MEIKIYQGQVLEEIRKIPDKSIDSVITSPPYWKLRDYHVEDFIWGGDPQCDHEFVESKFKVSGGKKTRFLKANQETNWFETISSQCNKCGAWKGQLGQEPTPEMYIEHLMMVMREIWRILKPAGTVWINIGDTYGTQSGSTLGKDYDKGDIRNKTSGEVIVKPKQYHKQLMLIPHKFAIQCAEEGWIIRNDIVWAKQNGMPESVLDRFSKRHEYIFFMTKQTKYYFDLDAVRKPLGGNPGDVADFWVIERKGNAPKHPAAYMEEVIIKPVLAGSPEGGTILDPFAGTGTTLVAALKHNRNAIGIEVKSEHVKTMIDRTIICRWPDLWGK